MKKTRQSAHQRKKLETHARVEIWVTREELAQIDTARGDQSRAAYFRDAVLTKVKESEQNENG